MGKRKSGKGGLTGLSGFVLNAFKQDEAAKPKTPEATTSTTTIETAEPGPSTNNRPVKRQKTKEAQDTSHDAEDWTNWGYVEKYDATGLVPHYTKATEVPEHLKKYFSQRYRYFSQYSLGCLLDEEGWYSITPELVADQIAERCRCDTILDAFCGVGGNAIAFAKTCQRVIALDTNPTRLSLARHNAQIYGVADRIEFILADYRSFAKSYLSHSSSRSPNARKIDVVFLSPPWGGPSYLLGTNPDSNSNSNSGQANSVSVEASTSSNPAIPLPIEAHPEYSLSSILPIPGDQLFRLTRQITPNIAYYLPRNTRLSEISDLLAISDEIREKEKISLGGGSEEEGGDGCGETGKPVKDGKEAVEVEEEWMGTKLKALTCYFGGLAAGQEDLY